MLQDKVLSLLKTSGETCCSGEDMSRRLGVSRAAVWKAIEALRQEGYDISSAPRRGYRLESSPDCISAGELTGALEGKIVGSTLVCLESTDSTNNEVKRRALAGAPDGLAVIAGDQTAGRGRKGRSFLSPAQKGLYLSVLLRPRCSLSQVSTLTAWAAVAACDAIEQVCGVRPGIKWTNDLILNRRKVCGILTELSIEAETGLPDYVVLGIGINLSQTETDFGPEVAPLAISLEQALGQAPRRADLAAALLSSLDQMYAAFPHEAAAYLNRYRNDCITLGHEVRLIRPDDTRTAFAERIDDDFALVVRMPDGRQETVSTGEVSVRGLLGYT